MNAKTLLVSLAIATIIQPTTVCASTWASDASLTQASAKYRRTKDYNSLLLLVKQLKIGMPQKQVEQLLGVPDAMVVEGQSCYLSNKTMPQSRDKVSLLIEYRKTEYSKDDIKVMVTGKVESFKLLLSTVCS